MKSITIKPDFTKKNISLALAKAEQIKKSLADIHVDIDTDDCCQPATKEDLEELAEIMFSNLDYFYNIINRVVEMVYDSQDRFYEMFYSHLQGHLPPINSPSQMEKALEVLGVGKDFVVEKKHIYSSTGDVERTLLDISKK